MVKKSEHKKQHYIPRCYLKEWCDPDCPPKQKPYVWIFEKESREGKRKAPKNIFSETDMYTIKGVNGERDLIFEHGFAELERRYTKIRDEKLKLHNELNVDEHRMICTFIAAMHSRTKSQINFESNQFNNMLKMMDKLNQQMVSANEGIKKKILNINTTISKSKNSGLDYEEVKNISENPVETLLLVMIETEASLLPNLDFAIVCNNTGQGFITSDNPCIWYDPKAYTRPPFYKQPALMYETIEITLPITPNECIFLNRRNITGYRELSDNFVREHNRLVRFNVAEHYIVNRNCTDDYWFYPGQEPDDSWRKTHGEE